MAAEDIIIKAVVQTELDQASARAAKSQANAIFASGPGMAMAASAAATRRSPSGAPTGWSTSSSGLLLPPGGGGGMGAAAEAAAAGLNDLGTSSMDAARQASELGKRTRNFYSMMTGNPFQIMGELAKRITGSQGLIDRLDAAAFELDGAKRAFGAAKAGTAEYAQAEQRLVMATNEMAAASKAAGGARGKALGLATFGVQNLLTSVGLFGTFQLITVAFENLMGALDRAINPAKYLAEAIKEVGAAVAEAGSGAARLQQLGLGGDTPLARALDQVRVANEFQNTFGQLIKTIEAGTGNLGQISSDYANQLGRALKIEGGDIFAAQFSGVPGYQNLSRRNGASGYEAAAQEMAAMDAQRFAIVGLESDYRNNLERLLSSGVAYADALDRAAQETLNVAVQQARLASASTQAQALGERYGDLQFKMGLRSAETPVERAQNAVTAAQANLNRLQRASAAQSQATALESARRQVGQAGVAGTGDTVFDVAQRIINAKAEEDQVRRQQATQNAIAAASAKVAAAQDGLAKAEMQEDANKITEEMRDLLKGFDPAEQRKLVIEFAGNDKASKAFGEALMLFIEANQRGGGRRPGRDNT